MYFPYSSEPMEKAKNQKYLDVWAILLGNNSIKYKAYC